MVAARSSVETVRDMEKALSGGGVLLQRVGGGEIGLAGVLFAGHRAGERSTGHRDRAAGVLVDGQARQVIRRGGHEAHLDARLRRDVVEGAHGVVDGMGLGLGKQHGGGLSAEVGQRGPGNLGFLDHIINVTYITATP